MEAPFPVNRNELLADVREDFIQVEAAISAADPDRCRTFVSTEFYEQLVGTVSELAAHGHRRVHGAFEIHDQGAGRWIISQLGSVTIQGPVSGPSGQPLESDIQSELDRRTRDSEEHGRAFVTATLNFLQLNYHG